MAARAKFRLSLVLLIALRGVAAEGGRPIPRLERVGNRYNLLVDGQPFLMLGGQAHNSRAASARALETLWKSLVGIHGNTADVPLYWELIEPSLGSLISTSSMTSLPARAATDYGGSAPGKTATWTTRRSGSSATVPRTSARSTREVKKCGSFGRCARRLAMRMGALSGP